MPPCVRCARIRTWSGPSATSACTRGAEPFAGELWGLDKIAAPAGVVEVRGGGVTVAVVDSGADLGHEDLEDQLVPGVDYVDPGTRHRTTSTGHGTHMTGTIVARRERCRHQGVAPETKAMPLRVLDHNGRGSTAEIAKAFDHAADAGIRIVNASLGYQNPSRLVREAIEAAPDTLFVVPRATRRESTSAEYPCANTAAECALRRRHRRIRLAWAQSNYSATSVDLFGTGRGHQVDDSGRPAVRVG